MIPGIHRSPEAINDIVNIAAWIGRSNPIAAERFIHATEEMFDRIADMPHAGREVRFLQRSLRPMRFRPVVGFSAYLVFYDVTPETLTIVRVLHGARDLQGLLE